MNCVLSKDSQLGISPQHGADWITDTELNRVFNFLMPGDGHGLTQRFGSC